MAMAELAGSMPVDVMPGASDPASRSLPQQQLHHSLFPAAATFQTASRCAIYFFLENIGFFLENIENAVQGLGKLLEAGALCLPA